DAAERGPGRLDRRRQLADHAEGLQETGQHDDECDRLGNRQVALIAFATMTAWLTVRGDLTVPEAVALIVVLARFLEPFSVV
ncbi:hypothetical protein C6A85_10825, partial [Mycobacterium sp. ITM-2017-0098]